MHMYKEKKSKISPFGKGTKHDILLIAALLCLVLVAALLLFLLRTPGDTVTVTVDGRLYGEYSLAENRSVEIRSGDRYNLLIIADGSAYVSRASCPDGICAAHRPVSHDGESIICLPNKVVIEVHTQNRNQPDIIA